MILYDNNYMEVVSTLYSKASFLTFVTAEQMLQTRAYFPNGTLDKDGLVAFIKDIKKNTKLSDEDAAILAASK